MFRIGYRTIKTAIGTPIAIFIAQSLGLINYVSAGIITILCIQPTKKKSLQASWERLVACMTAMLYSIVIFETIGYHPVAIGLLLLFFIPTAVMLKVQSGIVTSSVIILHFYSAGNFSIALLKNEFGLILIGIGVALLMNLYMPSLENKLDEYQMEIEKNFKIIFKEITYYLRNKDSDWDGNEITETARLLEKAKRLASVDTENRYGTTVDNHYFQYFRMREKQFEIIERVLPILASLSNYVEQGDMIADFIEEVGENIQLKNQSRIFLTKLTKMKTEFERMELPRTRKEFEVRADLLHFVKEMEQYFIIKSTFHQLKKNENGKSNAN